MTTLVQMHHIRAANLCSRGARQWFESYNLPWSEFLSTGLPADLLDATGDALAHRVTAVARAEVADGRGR